MAPATQPPVANADRRTAVPAHARRLAVVLELLVLLALASSAFPLALTSPVWWLRLGDAIVNLAPVLLLAVILLRFSSLFLSPNDDQGATLIPETVQFASRWGVVFALLVPLQLIGFGWLWLETGNQLSAQLSQASTELAGLRTRLNAAASDDDLQRLLASTRAGLLPPLTPGSIPQQKAQLNEALDLSLSRLQGNLNQQRTSTLVTSIPGTLRVLIGAAIISTFLFTIRRHFQ